MKTTKKILSIVLAVMLLVGTVVVGVSADTAMVYEQAGSKLVYTATTDKTANADGVIELKAGETVTVSVYAQANYYFGCVGSEIFCWTAALFETITTDNVTTHNYVNNYTPTPKVIASDSAAQLGTGYKDGTYAGYLNLRQYSTDCKTPYDASTATLAYQFAFTVPADVAEGTTGEFRMPETCSATVATTTRMKQIYAAVNNSDTNYSSATVASEYPETIDLTGTIINFKIVTESADPCDYDALDAAIDQYESELENKDLYTADSWAEYEAAYEEANKIDRTLTVDEDGVNQATIDAATKALTDAKSGLDVIEYCSYTLLETAVLYCSELDADEDYYDPTDLAEWKAALAEAEELLAAKDTAPLVKSDENQAILDNAANTLQSEYDDLYEMYLDLSDLRAAIADCATPEKSAEFYDAAAYIAWQDALAAARDAAIDYDGTPNTQANRDAVAALASDLRTKYAALVPQYVNLDALTQAVADCAAPEKAEEYYDAEAYSAWETALAAAQAGLTTYAQAANTTSNQNAVAALASDLRTKYAALVPQYVNLDALTQAVADCATPEKAEEYYDAEAYSAWEAALAAAQAGLTTYAEAANTTANQDAVAALASDLTAKFAALVPQYVNLDALTQAVADCATPEKAEEYYDAEEYSAWETALAAAQAGLTTYAEAANTTANQDAVAALASDLTAKFAALDARYIDYSALVSAVANYGTTPESADAYTTETYDPYAAALARANEMLENRNDDAPASDTALAAQIAAAASELESTYKALELAPVDSIITSVTARQEFYKVGDTVNFDFLCSVTNVTKIQVVYSNGSTVTYHRGHSAATVADNGDGTETWTIAMKIYYDSAVATAKAKLGTVWEENGCKFTIQTKSDEDYSVKSAEVLLNDVAVTEFTTNDTVVLKIVCGPSTLRMRLVDQANGATSTYSRSKATQDVDGNWIWLITRKAGAGAYAYDIYTTGSANRLADEGTDLSYTVTAPVVVVGPSTGEDADIVISATAKARVLRDNEQTFTIVTDKNALGVRVVDQYGVVHTYTKDVASAIDNGDNTLTWTISTVCSYADTYKCTVQALYGSSWMSNGTTVNYKVVY